MLYSIAESPICLTRILIAIPFLFVGAALLWSTWHRKVWLRGVDGAVGLVLQGAVGAVFFLVTAWSTGANFLEGVECRSRLASGEVDIVQGPLTLQFRSGKTSGMIHFSIDGRPFRTGTEFACDCGFIQPLGRRVDDVATKHVRAKVIGNTVLALELVN
jgi:hypothetical protein